MRVLGLVLCASISAGCGDDPDPQQAQLDALLQRLDAMAARLDAMEDKVAHAEASAASSSARPESEASSRPSRLADPMAVQLPRAEAKAETPTLYLNVSASGLELDGVSMTRAQAEERFAEVARRAPDTRLVVLSAPEVRYDMVVELLDLAKRAGLDDIAMSVRVRGEGE